MLRVPSVQCLSHGKPRRTPVTFSSFGKTSWRNWARHTCVSYAFLWSTGAPCLMMKNSGVLKCVSMCASRLGSLATAEQTAVRGLDSSWATCESSCESSKARLCFRGSEAACAAWCLLVPHRLRRSCWRGHMLLRVSMLLQSSLLVRVQVECSARFCTADTTGVELGARGMAPRTGITRCERVLTRACALACNWLCVRLSFRCAPNLLVTNVPPVGADDMLLVARPAPAGSCISLTTELI